MHYEQVVTSRPRRLLTQIPAVVVAGALVGEDRHAKARRSSRHRVHDGEARALLAGDRGEAAGNEEAHPQRDNVAEFASNQVPLRLE